MRAIERNDPSLVVGRVMNARGAGPCGLHRPLSEWLEAAADARSVRLVPISPAIAAQTAALPATFHRDSADRLIVASCRVLGLPLLTRDARILRSRLVTRWRG
jgi:PIN domain nuclease of toxin-antitoxin system